MTNHLNGVCQKCLIKSTIPSDEEAKQAAIDYSETQIVRGQNLKEWDDETAKLIQRYFIAGFNYAKSTSNHENNNK